MIPVRIPWGLLLATTVVFQQSGAGAQLPGDSAGAGTLPSFQAPAVCPDAASWVDQVLERLTPEERELGRRQLAALVEAVEVSPDGKQASVRLRGADDARVVVGGDCREVLTGAALIAALAFGSGLDPEETMPPKGTAPTAAFERSAELETSDASAGALATQSRSGDRRALDRARPAASWPPQPIELDTRPLRGAIGAGAAAHTGLAPWPAALLDGVIELTWPEHGWSLRGRGSFGLARALVQERGAHFEYVGGGLDVCPLVLGAHLDWQVRSCLAFDLGQVRAAGEVESALRSATSHRLWWSAVGLAARLQSPRVYGVRFELEGGANVPLWHRRFEFDDPEATVFETPALAVSARLGLQVPLE